MWGFLGCVGRRAEKRGEEHSCEKDGDALAPRSAEKGARDVPRWGWEREREREGRGQERTKGKGAKMEGDGGGNKARANADYLFLAAVKPSSWVSHRCAPCVTSPCRWRGIAVKAIPEPLRPTVSSILRRSRTTSRANPSAPRRPSSPQRPPVLQTHPYYTFPSPRAFPPAKTRHFYFPPRASQALSPSFPCETLRTPSPFVGQSIFGFQNHKQIPPSLQMIHQVLITLDPSPRAVRRPQRRLLHPASTSGPPDHPPLPIAMNLDAPISLQLKKQSNHQPFIPHPKRAKQRERTHALDHLREIGTINRERTLALHGLDEVVPPHALVLGLEQLEDLAPEVAAELALLETLATVEEVEVDQTR